MNYDTLLFPQLSHADFVTSADGIPTSCRAFRGRKSSVITDDEIGRAHPPRCLPSEDQLREWIEADRATIEAELKSLEKQ